jgi:hypothetical protein
MRYWLLCKLAEYGPAALVLLLTYACFWVFAR